MLIGTVFLILLNTPRTSLGLSLSASPLSGKKNEKFEYNEKPLAHAQIINATFMDSTFVLSTWFQMSVKNTRWENSQLNGVQIVKSDLSMIRFVKSDLSGVKCRNCLFQDVRFEDCDLDGIHFLGSTLKDVHFVRSDLSRADFVSSPCSQCSMDNATAKTLRPGQLEKWQIPVKDSP